MLGLEISSDFMLCLGVVCILSGVMFFYFKRNLTLLENAQMEQAKLLQSVIMSMQNMPSSNLDIQGAGSQNELIDVSDDSDSDSEGDDESSLDSDDEIEDVQPVQDIDEFNRESDNEEETLELEEEVVETDGLIENIKVVEMNNLGIEEESLEIEEDTLDPSLSEDTSTLNSESIQHLAGDSLVSLKSLKVGDLRKMVLEKGLHDKPKTLKKSELITLLNE
tara:strand:- start:21 stop:683 length:663 start_codon:yes stop_codon:yes gene_type:complete